MPIKIQATTDTGLNMTPMIDIVFQLILFFLFNLRFKSMEFRIESTLPDRGLSSEPRWIPEDQPVRVSLFRLDAEDPARARTKLRLAGRDLLLPPLAAPAA